MRTYDTANYALNRKPENRRIYAEQQVAWFYVELLKVQQGLHTARTEAGQEFCRTRQERLSRYLAEAHELLLKACVEMGPARVITRRSSLECQYQYEVRDATGHIRDISLPTYANRMLAVRAGIMAAIHLGLDVE